MNDMKHQSIKTCNLSKISKITPLINNNLFFHLIYIYNKF